MAVTRTAAHTNNLQMSTAAAQKPIPITLQQMDEEQETLGNETTVNNKQLPLRSKNL